MRSIDWSVDPGRAGGKLYYFLRNEAKLSSRMITSLKHVPGSIMVNGEPSFTTRILCPGDVVRVIFPPSVPDYEPVDGALNVVFEDDDILVIDKPAGLAVHPTHNHQGDTLANLCAAHLLSQGKDPVFRAVGRLDKNTSGLLLAATTRYSASLLNADVDKRYCALVTGVFEGSGTINAPIIRPDPMLSIRSVGDGGLPAVTHWTSLATDGRVSLLDIRLETGRTHQIRVHFAHIGAPLLGDSMYGAPDLSAYYPDVKRAALHCCYMEFTHPVLHNIHRFFADLPEDMYKTVELFTK